MNTEKRWYQKTGWIVTLLVLFFPVGLFLMWRYTTWNKYVKIGITTLFILFTIGNNYSTIVSTSSSPNNATTPQVESKTSEEQKEKDAQEQTKQLQALSTSFCAERSKPNVSYVKLEDFIALYEAKGESSTLHMVTGVAPTPENCQKVANICLKLWSIEDCKNIAERKIWIGMDGTQLHMSWGIPDDKNNTTFSFGVHSQWVYGLGEYVYLEGESKDSMKVTSWQN